MLVVDARGGLGNRLMALTSAGILAEHLGCALRIVWEAVPGECASPIAELFEDLPAEPLATMERAAGWRCFHRVPGPAPEIEARLERGETVLMRSWTFIRPEAMEQREFGARLFQEYARLKPLPTLLARVPVVPEDTIGVHIRRCDNWRSTRYSPLALFFRALDRHCRREPAARFLVASDAPGVIRQVRDRYGPRVLATADSGACAIAAGPAALIDMLALARTRLIYHGFMSSFAYTSHLLSQRPIRCVSVPHPPASWHHAADLRHDRLMEWNRETGAWQKRADADASGPTRIRAELLLRWTRFVCSDPFQRWPVRRMRRWD